jgi:UDP-glucuronate decarboxylase
MDTSDAVTGPVNIGNLKEFSILELAATVISLTGSPSRIIHEPLPQDDPRQRRPDIWKASQALSWTPRARLKEYSDDRLILSSYCPIRAYARC